MLGLSQLVALFQTTLVVDLADYVALLAFTYE